MENSIRCFGSESELYLKYHDEEWGVPVYDDTTLFEFLVLEGAQAGLSWLTVLKKRNGYRKFFYNYDIERIIYMTDEELESLRNNSEIIRNKLKIYSVRTNAKIFKKIQKEYGSFSNYLWNFVNNKQIVNNWTNLSDVPTSTELSDIISKDLKKRGMKFVETTIIYSYLQAIGIIDDHINSCICRKRNKDYKKI